MSNRQRSSSPCSVTEICDGFDHHLRRVIRRLRELRDAKRVLTKELHLASISKSLQYDRLRREYPHSIIRLNMRIHPLQMYVTRQRYVTH
jgi:hypothetical protein